MFAKIKNWFKSLFLKQLFAWGKDEVIEYIKSIPYHDKFKFQEWLLIQLRDTAQPLTQLTETKWDDWSVDHVINTVKNPLIWSIAYDLFIEIQGTPIQIITKEEEPNPTLVEKIRERLAQFFGREVGSPDYVGDEMLNEEVSNVALILSLITALASLPAAFKNFGRLVKKIREIRNQ